MSTVESSRTLATSADATLFGTLAADPFTGIGVPFVALVGDSPERCLDIVPPPLVIEPASNQLCYECATSPASSPLVELGNELVINGNVQSHVPTIAHKAPPLPPSGSSTGSCPRRGDRAEPAMIGAVLEVRDAFEDLRPRCLPVSARQCYHI